MIDSATSSPAPQPFTIPVKSRIGFQEKIFTIAILQILTLTLSACSGTQDSITNGKSFSTGDAAIILLPKGKRPALSEIRGRTLEGQPLDIASYSGRMVVINVWASWCPPCRKEAPQLTAAYDSLNPTGVEFVGINTKEDGGVPAAMAFQRNYQIPYKSIFDKDGSIILLMKGAVSPENIPTTLVIDSDGRIAARINGAVTKTTLEGIISDTKSE